MLDALDRLDGLTESLAARARRDGGTIIWRAQTTRSAGVIVRDGKIESASTSSISGQGVQRIAADGATAIGSRDDLEVEPALAILDRLGRVLADSERLALERTPWPELPVVRERAIPDHAPALAEFDVNAAAPRLIELERRIAGSVPDVTLRLSLRAELEGWRILRSDGTDVSFAIPRLNMTARVTAGGQHGISTGLFSPHAGVLDDDAALAAFHDRVVRAAELTHALADAPSYPAGSYPILIDFALAKGLAHEAFGHAAEADGFRSSVLAEGGRFRVGERVGGEHVSIVDEPVPDDHAWQPFSANGVRREAATIVDRGRLKDGLTDPWSAEPAGLRITGAARAESYRNAPQPRMTNIRIEVDQPLPAPGDFHDYDAERVRDLVADAGILARHPKVVYLSGYTGGQVNPATGDFVFNCKAIYELSAQGQKLHKPAIFTGSMFGALESIREGFGELRLDAIGFCGKWGQSVPSSGGSHYFLMLEPHEAVTLGGR